MKYNFLYVICFFISNFVFASAINTSGKFSVGVVNPMQDVDLGVWDGESDVSFDIGYCVYSTRKGSPRNFFQTNNSNNGYSGNYYYLSNEQGNLLPATIETYQPSRGRFISMQPNSITRVDEGLSDCSSYGQEPYFFRIFISATDLNSLATGEYTSTITTTTRSRRNRDFPIVYDSFDIKIIKGNVIRVGDLKDIDLGTYDGVTTLQTLETFCVYLNNDNSFNITFYDDSPQNGFNLRNTDNLSYSIPYVLDFTTFPDRGVYGNAIYNLNENVAYYGFKPDDNYNCDNEQLSHIRVTVDPSSDELPSGEYYSTLNVVVSPD